MPIRRKPRSVDEFIQEGSDTPKSATPAPSEQTTQNVRLRVSADLLAEIDAAVNRRRSGISRHAWIMEAIVEKLDRERG